MIHPVQRLCHRQHGDRARSKKRLHQRQILVAAEHPACVVDAGAPSFSAGCRKHVGLWVQTQHRVCPLRERDCQLACSAAKVDRDIIFIQIQTVNDLIQDLAGIAVAVAVIQLGNLTAELQGHEQRLATVRLRNKVGPKTPASSPLRVRWPRCRSCERPARGSSRDRGRPVRTWLRPVMSQRTGGRRVAGRRRAERAVVIA